MFFINYPYQSFIFLHYNQFILKNGGFNLIKKSFGIATLVLSLALTSPNLSYAEDLSQSKNDLSKSTYSNFIGEGVVSETVSYNSWVDINTNDSFEELEEEFPVPDRLMEVDPSNEKDKSYSIPSVSYSIMAATSSKGPVLKKGDILVSNATSSYGLTGHAGIAISSSQVLHISGAGAHPKVISSKTWQDRYGIVKGQKEGSNIKTNVYRIKSTTNASKAANWAVKNYKGKKYDYIITPTISSKNPTYCSKIVWQAYRSIKAVNYPAGDIPTPYGLPKYFKKAQNLKGMGYL